MVIRIMLKPKPNSGSNNETRTSFLSPSLSRFKLYAVDASNDDPNPRILWYLTSSWTVIVYGAEVFNDGWKEKDACFESSKLRSAVVRIHSITCPFTVNIKINKTILRRAIMLFFFIFLFFPNIFCFGMKILSLIEWWWFVWNVLIKKIVFCFFSFSSNL